MNEMYFSGNNPKFGMQPSTNYLQQADTSKHEIKDINDTLLIAKKLEEFTLPPFLRLKKNDPKVNLSHEERSRMFDDLTEQDNIYGACLEANRLVYKDKRYAIDDGLIVFSMNGDIRIVQVKKYPSPFMFACGKCNRFEHKPLLICRENYSGKHDGQFIIPDIFIPDSAKFVLKKFPKRHKKWYNIVRKDVREAHLLGEKENGKYKSNNRERTTVDTERIRDNQ